MNHVLTSLMDFLTGIWVIILKSSHLFIDTTKFNYILPRSKGWACKTFYFTAIQNWNSFSSKKKNQSRAIKSNLSKSNSNDMYIDGKICCMRFNHNLLFLIILNTLFFICILLIIIFNILYITFYILDVSIHNFWCNISLF